MSDVKNMLPVGNYTDFKGLNALRHQVNTDPNAAKKEVAEQFESLLVQMLMKSMRDATQALSSDSSLNEQEALYTDLFDKQLSLVVSHSGTGLAKVIEASLNKAQPVPVEPIVPRAEPLLRAETTKVIPEQTMAAATAIAPTEKKEPAARFNSTNDFVKTLWSSAKTAASILGTDPKLLLAQAALETNWGKSILSMGTGQSTHNLFNIKADSSWNSASVQVDALEQADGIMVKNKSKFRSYDSFNDSFTDYVHFLKNNSRYDEALKHASDPHQFAQQLQKASYATDEKYSEKIMQIYSGKRLNDLIAEQKL
ncbi:MAG: flagellar assembly peptidoglycan hydrolase FlgJ [Legionellales bacterium]